MADDRLAPGIEVTALIRRAEALGGFGTVIHKGDPERGTLLLTVPGITSIDRGEWGDTWYWSLTRQSAQKLFA